MFVHVKTPEGQVVTINAQQIVVIEDGKEEGLSEIVFVGGKKIVIDMSRTQLATELNKAKNRRG